MSEGGDPSKKIKVVDRRRFTEGGELRPDRDVQPAVGSAPAAAPAEGRGPAEQGSREETPQQQPNDGDLGSQGVTSDAFLELVETLAQQTELFMTGAHGLPRQPEQARRLIDYLGALEVKTRGNLSAQESQILSNVIFQLRMSFVQTGP